MCRIFSNKKGQVGETVTWIFATVVIISILGISFFIAEISFGENKKVDQTTQADILVSKSFFSYLLTDNVYSQLENDGAFNEFNGELAEAVFDSYRKDYPRYLWLGFGSKENKYFGISAFALTGKQDLFARGIIPVSEQISFRGGSFYGIFFEK